MELADSVTLDPHKWLYQPVELGALLVRDGSALRRGFEISPEYLKDVETVDREVNFSDLGLQLTRSCRALTGSHSATSVSRPFARQSTTASISHSTRKTGSNVRRNWS
jgi:aromatic-L-amino-acid/L-tryptophan decarboxylase